MKLKDSPSPSSVAAPTINTQDVKVRNGDLRAGLLDMASTNAFTAFEDSAGSKDAGLTDYRKGSEFVRLACR